MWNFTGFSGSWEICRVKRASTGTHRRHSASKRDAQRRANARVAMRERPERSSRADGAENETGCSILSKRHRSPGDGR